MKSASKVTLHLAVLVLGLAASTLVAAPAHAAAEVEFAYDSPQIDLSADRSRVRWNWTVQNGDETVTKVTVEHRLDPELSDITASEPCEVTDRVITCRWESLEARGQRSGYVEAALPSGMTDAPEPGITGRVTWKS